MIAHVPYTKINVGGVRPLLFLFGINLMWAESCVSLFLSFVSQEMGSKTKT